LIREAVERLKARGVEVTFVELVGVPNSKVIREIKKADLIIDQMYADYAMPGLATESAWYGKPVLICGYAVDDWQNWMQPGDLPPTCFIHPDELDDALYRFATDPVKRQAVGTAMYEFVSSRWRPEQIAANYLRCFEDAPSNWWLDPKDCFYVNGCSISEARLKVRLRGYLEKFGVKALQLRDKPELAAKIVKFAGGNGSARERING
jgi:hypothetical protein